MREERELTSVRSHIQNMGDSKIREMAVFDGGRYSEFQCCAARSALQGREDFPDAEKGELESW